MTGGAGIWHTGLLCIFRADKAEGVRTDEIIFDRLLDFGHVAGDALAAGACFGMMRMLAHRSFEARRIHFGVAGEAERISGQDHV